ncbi:MFS transporter [Coraliomargarita sinensis]|uniref:MFS transporter n=1 Tax=Coraliomargarita sinensis TaxID=2174842 RepID=A0A317ZMI9_9BACT|nr:MFS transporter [Coraliomargarita sinensis]PXA05397.1 MFS transporter [Coraliomargarita sinensis]
MGKLEKWIYLKATDATAEELQSPKDEQAANASANFVRLLIARTGSKISDRLANPKTTLAWLLQTVGAPAVFVGLIVPIRESGSLLPQILLSNYLKRFKRRKFAWTLGAGLQGLAMLGCALVGLSLEGTAAGLSILGLVILFSLARGISSLSAKDVLGKSLPKDKRGQLTGYAGSASGLIAIAAAALLFLDRGNSDSTLAYAGFLTAAALIWWWAGSLNLRVIEPEGESEKLPLTKGLHGQLSLLREDRAFRDFLIVRGLAIGSGLSTPYLISLAHERLGGAAYWLGAFIIAEGLAAMLSGPIWGRMADRSSRFTLRIAMLLVALLLGAVIAYVTVLEAGSMDSLCFPLALFLNGLAHAGVRVGRKTHLVNLSGGNKRTDYVAVGNTLIGVLLIVAGLLTGLIALLSIQWTLALFMLAAATGAAYGKKLKA